MNNYIQLKCVFCNSSFTHLLGKQGLDPKYCSPHCRNRANYRKSIDDGRVAKRLDEIKSKRRAERLNAPQVCAKCGKSFYRIASHSGSYVYCSDTCQKEATREQRRKARKSVACKEYKHSTRNNRKRARKYGCDYDSSIRRKAVFQRDGWKCRICGKTTPERLLGKNKPNAPTLDHIVPLSLGGGHTWKNVQCACRQCNSEKSNRFVEPWLFPL